MPASRNRANSASTSPENPADRIPQPAPEPAGHVVTRALRAAETGLRYHACIQKRRSARCASAWLWGKAVPCADGAADERAPSRHGDPGVGGGATDGTPRKPRREPVAVIATRPSSRRASAACTNSMLASSRESTVGIAPVQRRCGPASRPCYGDPKRRLVEEPHCHSQHVGLNARVDHRPRPHEHDSPS
jgi:hypothetical protein